jgi:hypothetical protein
MLKRREWKYDVRVCKRTVCWECRERCAWELEMEQEESNAVECAGDRGKETEGNRGRADSVLQDEDVGDGELKERGGIERGVEIVVGCGIDGDGGYGCTDG